jgi:hypothetical protein
MDRVEIDIGAAGHLIYRRVHPHGVEGDQVGAAVAAAQAGPHGVDDGAVQVALQGPIAAQHPDDVPVVAVAGPQPLAVGAGVLGRKHLGAVSPFQIVLVTPGGQQRHKQAQLRRPAHGPIHVGPIAVFAAQVRPHWVEIEQRQAAVGVGRAQAVLLRQGHRLDHVEALPGPHLQIMVDLAAGQLVEQLPGRIAQVKERRAVRPHEVAPARMYGQSFHLSSPLVSPARPAPRRRRCHWRQWPP